MQAELLRTRTYSVKLKLLIIINILNAFGSVLAWVRGGCSTSKTALFVCSKFVGSRHATKAKVH
jgi:hypothetical protein